MVSSIWVLANHCHERTNNILALDLVFMHHFWLGTVLAGFRDYLSRTICTLLYRKILSSSFQQHLIISLDKYLNHILKTFLPMFSAKLYSPKGAYFQSKGAQILCTKYLARKAKEANDNVTCCSLHPGVIYTDLYDYTTVYKIASPVLKKIWKVRRTAEW